MEGILVGDMFKLRTIGEFIKQGFSKTGSRLILSDLAKKDMEIVVDILLKLQQLAVQERNDIGLENSLYNYGLLVPSWFIFDETLRGEYVYPPLTLTAFNKNYIPNLKSPESKHFVTIRRLLQWVCTSILTTCGIPNLSSINKATDILKPLIENLQRFNNGPLPIFTTNYDELIEAIFTVASEEKRIIDGFDKEPYGTLSIKSDESTDRIRIPIFNFNPGVWHQCKKDDVALFHLHGKSTCFIDFQSGKVFDADCTADELTLLHKWAWESDSKYVLGAIMPATCKERYMYSPPFGVAYDYLHESLKHADICIIIGMSGRDHMIKWLLSQSVRNNSKLHFIIITRKNPPPHITDILPKERTDIWKDGLDSQAVKWTLWRVRQLLKVNDDL